MRDLTRVAWLTLISLTILAGPAAARPNPAPEKTAHYVCPPCGMPCDDKVYDAPGACPVCGARLVDQAAARTPKKAAILIFEGVQIIDYTGPYEVLGQGGFDVYTVSETKDAITTSMGMRVIPEHTFADAPQSDVLVVPGGNVDGPRKSASTLKWIRERTASAQHTLSVCNGAFILASAGLLDGLSATTFHRMIDDLKAAAPRTRVVSDKRFVDNGRIITAAGLSSGIDGALHVLSEMLGKGRAQAVALNMEYDWRPDSGYARAALADRLIPEVELEALGDWIVVKTEGTTERWDIVLRGTSDLSPAELLDRIGKNFTSKGKWSGVEGGAAGFRNSAPGPVRSAWRFTAPDGRPWNGVLRIQPGEGREYTLALNISRMS